MTNVRMYVRTCRWTDRHESLNSDLIEKNTKLGPKEQIYLDAKKLTELDLLVFGVVSAFVNLVLSL